jgi:hypothetical protein
MNTAVTKLAKRTSQGLLKLYPCNQNIVLLPKRQLLNKGNGIRASMSLISGGSYEELGSNEKEVKIRPASSMTPMPELHPLLHLVDNRAQKAYVIIMKQNVDQSAAVAAASCVAQTGKRQCCSFPAKQQAELMAKI